MRLISYLRARVSAGARQLPDVVGERFGRELFGAEHHPLAARAVDQEHVGVAREGGAPALGGLTL